MSESIVIRITGDSGDGIQLVGEQLTITAALSGKDVRTLPDFPAEIRAPVGTLAGVSGFQLAMAEEAIFTAGEELDVLVALNPAALKHAFEFLKPGGLLILNEDSMSEKDWQKANLDVDFLSQQADSYQILSFPLITQTIKAVEAIDGISLSNTQAKKCKNFYILGLILWLFDLPIASSLSFIERKFARLPQVSNANQQCLRAGYNYAVTLELSRKNFQLNAMPRSIGTYRQISGIDALALALATITTKTNHRMLVSGYPITPASAILHACANLADFGIALFQAEDEIAAIGACLGASYGGDLAMTCTSGPGLDLKTEALGLAVVAELPLVVVDVQRAGASTGLPTKTGQSDLREALFGRHGEAPLPVLAANSPSDCFQIMLDAFRISVEFMTPVIVLIDAYLANAAEPWCVPNIDSIEVVNICQNRFAQPFARDERGVRSWNIPGTAGYIHQLGGLEKQGDQGRVSYDAANHQEMVKTRMSKIQSVAQTYKPLTVLGYESASILLIGWGSTYGSLRGAVEECAKEGLAVAYVHLRNLFPLPNDLGVLLNRYKKILVAELNSGHLCQFLRANYLVDAQLISQCSGQPFTVKTLTNAIFEESRRDLI